MGNCLSDQSNIKTSETNQPVKSRELIIKKKNYYEKELANQLFDDIEEFSFNNMVTKCKIVDVYDGDSITIGFFYDEEPYIGKFRTKTGKTLIIASFHARPIKQNPQEEISNFPLIDSQFENKNILIMGDFNYSYSSSSRAFQPIIEKGYVACLSGKVKTSLKRKKTSRGYYLSRAYDNILYNRNNIHTEGCKSLDLVEKLGDLKKAQKVSDHLPVYGVFRITSSGAI